MKIESLTDNPRYVKTVVDWIYAEFIQDIRPGIPYDKVFESFSGRFADRVPCTFVAVTEDRCVGTVTLFANDLRERQDLTPWLGALYVDPAYRNRGIAKTLMDAVCGKARDLGYDKIYLRTEHAGEYYKKHGWRSIHATVDEFGLDTEVFTKDLSAST